MPHRWARAVLIPILGAGLSIVLGTGCFVFEEIDNGMKELERFDGKTEAQPAPAKPASQQAKEPQVNWWEKARTLGSKPVDEGIVRCELDGAVQFMDREDCLGRGGRPS